MGLVWVLDDYVAVLLMILVFPRFDEEYRYHKQLNVLLGVVWFGISVTLWFWVREVAFVVLLAACSRLSQTAASMYRKHREEYKPGSAVLLALWDAFGEWGGPFVWPFKAGIKAGVRATSPITPWFTVRSGLTQLVPKTTGPVRSLIRRYGHRVREEWWPSSSNDPKPYAEILEDSFEGRRVTMYWVEEHRTPLKGFAGGRDQLLTTEQARELKLAVKEPHGGLTHRRTGEKIGTWHYDVTVLYPNGRYLRWATVPAKNKPVSGKLGIFPGYKEGKTGRPVGEQAKWVLQPEHYRPTNPEVIEQGYGKGVCKVVKEGKCELWLGHTYGFDADGRPIRYLHLKPEGIDGRYVVLHYSQGRDFPGDGQHLVQRLKLRPDPELGKLKMKEIRFGTESAETLLDDPNWMMQVKKDGAMAEVVVEHVDGRNRVTIVSHRTSKRMLNEYGVETKIDYTDRLGHFREQVEQCPEPLNFKGRVEVWCRGPNGQKNLQRVLLSDEVRARTSGVKPFVYLVDVEEVDGEDLSSAGYREKHNHIREIHAKCMAFKVAESRYQSREAKIALWEKTVEEPWVDGVVFKQLDNPEHNVKMKHRWLQTHTAEIIMVEEGTGKYSGTAGKLHVRDKESGKEFRLSGKGLTDETRSVLWEHKKSLEGLEVEYHRDPDRFEHHDGEIFQPSARNADELKDRLRLDQEL